MDLSLVRIGRSEQGIFGVLMAADEKTIGYTLEHAYPDGNGGWIPKVAAGEYPCKRHEPNRLPYETFMLEGVPDFEGEPVSGILIHKGNFDKDSEGCILVGSYTDLKMVYKSGIAFEKLMQIQDGIDEFTLKITG